MQSQIVISPRRNGKVFHISPITPNSPKANQYFFRKAKKPGLRQEQFYSLQHFEQFQKSRLKVIQSLENDINSVRKRKGYPGDVPKATQQSPYIQKLSFLLRLKTHQ